MYVCIIGNQTDKCSYKESQYIIHLDMLIVFSIIFPFFTIITSFLAISTSVSSILHQDELNALKKIATTLGINGLDLSSGDPCYLGYLKMIPEVAIVSNPELRNNTIDCDCSFNNNTTCRIINIDLKTLSLRGKLPPELAELQYLQTIDLCRNYLSGSIPMEWASLPNLTYISLCANRLSGPLPSGLQNFNNLRFLGVEANQFSGPIPDGIGNLTNLKGLQLGSNQFTGSLPNSLARLVNLEDFDLSFNNLTGDVHGGRAPAYTYLTGNRLSGEVESGVFLKSNAQIDLSYNNFSWWPSCQENSNINTYRSSYLNNLTGILPCAGPINCTSYQRTLHINCGGDNIVITKSSHKITYQADNTKTKAATNQQFKDWGISNTGEFFSDGHTKESSNTDDTYIISTSLRLSGDSPDIYKTARRSPLSLVYYAFCMENGTYSVKLHFMEIQFSDQELYSRLGRRIFDVYVQGVLFLRDFNIKEAANGTLKPVFKTVSANVTNNILEIQLYWAGKGTTLIPERGNYGPLISAISLCHSSMEPQCGAMKTELDTNYPLIFGVVGSLIAVTLLAFGLYTQKICIRDKYTRERDLRAQGVQTVCFTWRQLEAATNNFDQANKLGEGGFGSVFRGELSDGTIIAVKQLSSKSCQGNREFVNEIGMISGLNHPNLVKLYGCCVEKNQLMLVYEYMENNSLALALFGKSSLKLQWEVRQNICVGIARGLEFLHEGSMIRMVHRDIKTSNVLLDADLNAKISDFGLARLHEEEHTHISTKIAGTVGYMAPEYALWGHLTEKADVFSFGVVAMEIVSGKSNMKRKGSDDHVSLINWALTLHQRGDIMEIVDPVLQGDFNSKEAVRMIKVAFLCTNSSPSLRPTMSEAVKMLEGEINIREVMSDPGLYGHNWSISNLNIDTHGSSSVSGVAHQTATTMQSSVSGSDLYPFCNESMILNSTAEFSSSPI
ncbi:probable LRR receptor-like serine/threonine-protein kinase At1g29720 isoform X4 [Brassica napus]|uniref:probable LRR receptor-like serine/threonine-protein kinase At1g29720 isoform X4 n=1 Tax=Brassica napus TaxID=3708 RepID=UPI002078DAFB|nr:probable LRR receptor-like serine/threonine-protein kinase At1g29720 isoform X4 [Brassica napus]